MNNPVIRVLQVFATMSRGGAEAMIMNNYRKIDKTKIQFDFLVHRKNRGEYEDEIESMGGKVYRMSPINPLFPYKYYRELNEFLKLHPYKIIHSHINALSVYPIKIAKKNNIGIRIAHSHTSVQPFSLRLILQDPKESIRIFAKNLLRKKVNKYANYHFACGEVAGEWLFGKNQSFKIVNNAIDSELFKYDKEKSINLKQDYNLNNDLVLGHIGNFTYPKNYPFILEVFKEVKKLKQNTKLVLIGNGHLRHEVEVIAESLGIHKDLVILGLRSDIPDLLQMLDVFLFPSHYEGLPVTLVEAQASGLKIFASNAITSEVALTEDIKYMSLNHTAKHWAEEILKSVPYERKDNSLIIKEKRYDIVENAKELQEFYLSSYKAYESVI